MMLGRYDQTPSNSTLKDLSGNSVYTKAFEFREDMRDGDTLDCRWIREDGKIVKSKVQLVAIISYVFFANCLVHDNYCLDHWIKGNYEQHDSSYD